MDFKYAILSDNPTIEEVELQIKLLTAELTDHRNMDQGKKRILNSVYGVMGYKKFPYYHRRIAECVTGQSRDCIIYTIDQYNDYFWNRWAGDVEVHRAMGIKVSRNLPSSTSAIAYADTDSIFLLSGEVMATTDYAGNHTDFALLLHQHLLHQMNADIMVQYGRKYGGFECKPNGDPSMNLELEEIDHTVLLVSKKKYIKDTAWAGGVFYKPLEKVKVKGLEMNQSSTPRWVRDKLTAAVRHILARPNITSKELNDWVAINVKAEFDQIHVDNISVVERANNYHRFVIDDKKSLTIGKNCKPHVRGSAFHNHLLYNSSYVSKYQPIESGQRVCWYHTNDPRCEYFAYVGGNYPIEFAPDCDRDLQFQKTFLSPLNNILSPMGIEPLRPDMISTEPLF